MTKNKPAPATADDIKEIVDLLDSRFDNADTVFEEVAKLRDAVEQLTRTVQALEGTIDDLRGDFEWARKSENLRTAAARPLTSIPQDPLARDFRERLNRLTPADLPPELQAPHDPVPEQPELF